MRESTMTEILIAVSFEFDVRLRELTGKCQRRSIARPRMVAMYLARQVFQFTFMEIADFLDRDHSTVMHAQWKIEELMDGNGELKQSVERLKHKLTLPPELEAIQPIGHA